jgi:hypothetical protein
MLGVCHIIRGSHACGKPDSAPSRGSPAGVIVVSSARVRTAYPAAGVSSCRSIDMAQQQPVKVSELGDPACVNFGADVEAVAVLPRGCHTLLKH